MSLSRPGTPLYLDTRIRVDLTPMMTGTGISRDYCGEKTGSKIVCSGSPDDHHYRVLKLSCHSLGCPICWPSRATELARKSGEKVWAYHVITQGHTPSHWSFNMAPEMFPSPSLGDEVLIRKIRMWGVAQAKAAGIIGALILPHAYRIKKEYQAQFSEEAERRNILERKNKEITSKWNRYDIVREHKNWRDFVDYSPHVHLVGYGYLLKADKFKSKYGFVYRKHGNLNALSDVQACINYLLSHAPLAKGVQVYSFFGVLANNQLVPLDEYEEVEVCQDCGKPMINDHTHEPVYIRYRTFTLRGWPGPDTGDPGG